MKIDNYMNAYLPRLDPNMKPGSIPNQGSFASYLIDPDWTLI
jgi:hypothetical protein